MYLRILIWIKKATLRYINPSVGHQKYSKVSLGYLSELNQNHCATIDLKGGYYKHKLLRQVYLWTFNVIIKSTDTLRDYYFEIIWGCIEGIEESLKKPSINNKAFLKYTEALFRLLSASLDNIKGKSNTMADIWVKGFVYITK